jgi:pSer/pThr/pTyr-binding forkhead associated (FHA) protein
VVQTKEQTKQFALNLGENSVGRFSGGREVAIALKDPYTSKHHATITLEEKDGKIFFFISDSKSTNGTFNRNKVKLKSELKYPFTPDDYYIIGLSKLSIKFN